MLDGRHTGTGGGNHFVLGGATPADSPFLRRPDLLRSLLAYWHNHPSLSYLFSGLFVGPTSQAPRIDEARNDSLYELELAFRQLPPRGQAVRAVGGGSPVPQPADRLHRQHASRRVLHRQDVLARRQHRPAGIARDARLRDAAARAHEPHAAALLRSLIARFWREPYEPPRLARWGTELHDRFMLPYFIERDLADVLVEQNQAGFPLKPQWFDPHFEFRFPKYGDFDGVRGSKWNCARRSSPGMSWAKKAQPAARCATWIPRSNACR